MIIFIHLTDNNSGRKMRVQVDKIKYYEPKDTSAFIFQGAEDYFYVKEDCETIDKKIADAIDSHYYQQQSMRNLCNFESE